MTRTLLTIVACIARFASGLCVVPLFALLSVSTTSLAKSDTPMKGESFDELARKLTKPLHASRAKRIVILDFEDPNKEVTPLGAWLTDQFAAASSNSWAPIKVVDRKQIVAEWERLKIAEPSATEPTRILELAKSFQATVVKGSYSASENGLGLTLTWYPGAGRSDSLAAKLAMTEEMKSHLTQPLESLVPKDGIFSPGTGGISVPQCVSCPQPNFSAETLRRHSQGTVLLMVVVDAKGRSNDVTLKKGSNPELDEDAIRAVRRWTFRPATNVDGKPVAARTPVEIAIRAY
jgi:TonB family protein